MNPATLLQSLGCAQVIVPQAIKNNGSYTISSTNVSDCDAVMYVISIGATDVSASTFKVTESDDDSAYSDITGTDLSASITATVDNTLVRIIVNMSGGRKKYQKLAVTVGNSTGAYMSCEMLKVLKIAPLTAAAAGFATASALIQ